MFLDFIDNQVDGFIVFHCLLKQVFLKNIKVFLECLRRFRKLKLLDNCSQKTVCSWVIWIGDENRNIPLFQKFAMQEPSKCGFAVACVTKYNSQSLLGIDCELGFSQGHYMNRGLIEKSRICRSIKRLLF